jgi:ABC-type glycerol-3-phosphate transport system substrate-binding protein
MRRAGPRISLVLLAVAAGTAACGSGDGDADADWASAAPLFDPAHVVTVDVEMAQADWDTLRSQTRTLEDLFSAPRSVSNAGPGARRRPAAAACCDRPPR